MKTLDHENPQVIKNALNTLGLIGPKANIAVPRISTFLDDKNLRFPAVKALGNIGSDEKDTLARLHQMKEDPNPHLQIAVHLACWQIEGDEESLDVLRGFLKFQDGRVRADAVRALSKVARNRNDVLADLQQMSNDPSFLVQDELSEWREEQKKAGNGT